LRCDAFPALPADHSRLSQPILTLLKLFKALQFILKIGATHEIDQSVAGVRGHNLIVMGG